MAARERRQILALFFIWARLQKALSPKRNQSRHGFTVTTEDEPRIAAQ
jgi:hypothetical protein